MEQGKVGHNSFDSRVISRKCSQNITYRKQSKPGIYLMSNSMGPRTLKTVCGCADMVEVWFVILEKPSKVKVAIKYLNLFSYKLSLCHPSTKLFFPIIF